MALASTRNFGKGRGRYTRDLSRLCRTSTRRPPAGLLFLDGYFSTKPARAGELVIRKRFGESRQSAVAGKIVINAPRPARDRPGHATRHGAKHPCGLFRC
jgi:hypothetical protein